MGTELEDGGALVSAGLMAAELDKSSLHARGAAEAGGTCANCGALLSGAFCHRCGQAAHLHRSLLHMAEEALHGLLHFEAKAWRTLPLLVARPGVLTRRYIDGQRVRYVSPLALFLFTVFLLFFVISFTAAEPRIRHERAADGAESRDQVLAELKQDVEESRRDVASAQRELEKARRESEGVADATVGLAAAQAAQSATEAALARFDAAGAGTAAPRVVAKAPESSPAPGAGAAPAAAPKATESADEGAEDLDWRAMLAQQQVKTGNSRLDVAMQQQMRNPDLFIYKFRNAASKFSFLLIPLSLPFLWLMFLGRPDVTVYDHAVFSMYSLSFMSLLFSMAMLVMLAGVEGPAIIALCLVPPVHMFLQLRDTYGLGFGGALWRTVALLGSAGTAFLVFLVLMVIAAAR